MSRKIAIILTIGLIMIISWIWAYPKIDQYFKVDGCLDQGGRLNYETRQCEFK